MKPTCAVLPRASGTTVVLATEAGCQLALALPDPQVQSALDAWSGVYGSSPET